MTDVAALVRAASNTTKIASSLRNQWEVRTKTRATLSDGAALDLVVRSQIDEVFLVLAHLGEAILPLGIFNKDYYLQTLGEVQASIASCGHDFLPMAWAELDAELQYVCTAGFTICACYSPMPVYRGFGACVLGDWDWACPDMSHLEEKAKKTAIRTIYGFKQRTDPQPMRPVFIAFDQAIQILQVKAMAFLEKRPAISSFADHEPRYGAKPKKEVKRDFELFEDWIEQVEKRGHPPPKGTKLTSFGVPFSTWTSEFSSQILRSHKDCETIMCNQMDPGRLLHSFVCRGGLRLEDGQVLLLPPRSPAESLAIWLEGLPGTSHKIVKWDDLDTERFESKISKSMRKKIGRYPLPTQYAVRNPQVLTQTSVSRSVSSPNVLEHPNTVSPPPYSHITEHVRPEQSRQVAELGQPDPRELAASSTSSQSRPQHTSSLPVPGTPSSSLKSIHELRRKTTGGALTTSSAKATGTSTKALIHTEQAAMGTQSPITSNVIELHEDTATRETSELESPLPVELPTDFQSEAPKGLSSSNSKPDNGNTTGDVSVLGQVSEVEGSDPQAAVLSEEPEPIVPGRDTDIADKDNNKSARSDTETSNHYLDLLNKVAIGEISPQALSAILAKGGSSPAVEKAAAATSGPAVGTFTTGSSSSKSPDSAPGSLPYPLSPTERKKNEWVERNKSATGPPYPPSPTETRPQTESSRDVSKDNFPTSLKPGA